MRYVMKQKIFSLGNDFTIKDDAGRDRYFVDGRVLSFGHKLSFQDMQNNELAFIRQKLFAWGPTYAIERSGTPVARIRKALFTFFRCKFTIRVVGSGELHATGNILHHEYAFTRSGRNVATVSKKWFTLGDTYGIDIEEGEDDVLILACAVVIDLACHRDRSRGVGFVHG